MARRKKPESDEFEDDGVEMQPESPQTSLAECNRIAQAQEAERRAMQAKRDAFVKKAVERAMAED